MTTILRGSDNFDSANTYTQPTSAGAVGTYAFAVTTAGNTGATFGGLVAGSSLYPKGLNVRSNDDGANYKRLPHPATLSGTWRSMGSINAINSDWSALTLYLRIS